MGSAVGDIGNVLESALGDIGGGGGGGGGGGLSGLLGGLGGGGGGGGIGGILGVLDPLSGIANRVGGMLEQMGVPSEVVDAAKIAGGCMTGDVCLAADGAAGELGDLSHDASQQPATTEMPAQTSMNAQTAGYAPVVVPADPQNTDVDVDVQDGDPGSNVDVDVQTGGTNVNTDVQSGGSDVDVNTHVQTGAATGAEGVVPANGSGSGSEALGVNDIMGWQPPDPALASQWANCIGASGGLAGMNKALYMSNLIQELNSNPSVRQSFEQAFGVQLGNPVQTQTVDGNTKILGATPGGGTPGGGFHAEPMGHGVGVDVNVQGGGGAGSTGCGSGGCGDDEIDDILNDPSMSLEDKLEMLMDYMGNQIDGSIDTQMQNVANAQQQQAQASSSSGGSSGSGGGGSSGSSGGSSSAQSQAAAQDASTNLQEQMQRLQDLMSLRSQMFSMVSNLEKSLSDTSMTILRNIGQ